MARLGSLGKYQLIKRIAVGGMSEIFLASQGGLSGFERAVIVKCIREDLSEETEVANMFLDEARIAACLKHPNIVHLYDVGEDTGHSYLAMEYIFGRDLMQIADRARALGWQLPIQFVLKAMCDALAGLHYAHEVAEYEGGPLHMVHRDVSPQNIIVSFDGVTRLLDFGIAKAEARLSQTRGGVLKGKYAYMSPEQVRGRELDHRSDQFSLAVVFYEVITNTRLFQRDTDYSTMEAVDRCEVPPIRMLRRDVPRRLMRVLRKAMRPKHKRRFTSCREMERMLDRLLRGSAVEQTEFMSQYMRKLFAHELAVRDNAIQQASGDEREMLLSTGFELLDRKDTRINPIEEAPLALQVYNQVLAQRQSEHTQIRERPTASGKTAQSTGARPRTSSWSSSRGSSRGSLSSSPGSLPSIAEEVHPGEDTAVRTKPGSDLWHDWRFLVIMSAGGLILFLFLVTMLSGPAEVEIADPTEEEIEEVEPARPGKDGFLSVSVAPHVQVKLDGEDLGRGAFLRRVVPMGSYKLLLRDTKSGEVKTIRIHVEADQERIVAPSEFQ